MAGFAFDLTAAVRANDQNATIARQEVLANCWLIHAGLQEKGECRPQVFLGRRFVMGC
jgi:hypothetical protein